MEAELNYYFVLVCLAPSINKGGDKPKWTWVKAEKTDNDIGNLADKWPQQIRMKKIFHAADPNAWNTGVFVVDTVWIS